MTRTGGALACLALAGLVMTGVAWRRGALISELAHDVIVGPASPLTVVLGDGGERVTADIWPAKTAVGHPHRVLVYTPGSGGGRGDNSMTAAGLAARGYLVVALDDVEREPVLAAAAPEPLRFDFSSDSAYQRTLALADAKTSRQAMRISRALDGLSALADSASPPGWLRDVDVRRAGAFGWSIGGAAAAEASINDRRIIAAVNMDGWLFGAAAQGAVTAPYLLMLSDYEPPGTGKLQNADPDIRNEALLTQRDLREESRLIARPGNLGLRFSGAVHEGFSDKILQPAFWRAWVKRDPVVMRRQIVACLDSFFRASFAHPGGGHDADMTLAGCSGPGVQRLKEISWPDSGAAKAPRMSAAGAK